MLCLSQTYNNISTSLKYTLTSACRQVVMSSIHVKNRIMTNLFKFVSVFAMLDEWNVNTSSGNDVAQNMLK